MPIRGPASNGFICSPYMIDSLNTDLDTHLPLSALQLKSSSLHGFTYHPLMHSSNINTYNSTQRPTAIPSENTVPNTGFASLHAQSSTSNVTYPRQRVNSKVNSMPGKKIGLQDNVRPFNALWPLIAEERHREIEPRNFFPVWSLGACRACRKSIIVSWRGANHILHHILSVSYIKST